MVRLVDQAIVVPKITLHDVIPQRTVLPVLQMAEQLVEPVPSDDFVLVEEEEKKRRRSSTRKWSRGLVFVLMAACGAGLWVRQGCTGG